MIERCFLVHSFIDSLVAGATATLLTMPLDVMKTRLMNAPPGKYNSLIDCFKDIVTVGPSGLFKGFIPAFIRLGKRTGFLAPLREFLDNDVSRLLGPHTILMFVFLEQLKKRFGYFKSDQQ